VIYVLLFREFTRDVAVVTIVFPMFVSKLSWLSFAGVLNIVLSFCGQRKKNSDFVHLLALLVCSIYCAGFPGVAAMSHAFFMLLGGLLLGDLIFLLIAVCV